MGMYGVQLSRASLSGSFSAGDLLEWHGFGFAKLWPNGKME